MNSHPIPPSSNIIKKRGENTWGGTRPKPSEKEAKRTKMEKNKKKTATYGNLIRGKPHLSAKNSWWTAVGKDGSHTSPTTEWPKLAYLSAHMLPSRKIWDERTWMLRERALHHRFWRRIGTSDEFCPNPYPKKHNSFTACHVPLIQAKAIFCYCFNKLHVSILAL